MIFNVKRKSICICILALFVSLSLLHAQTIDAESLAKEEIDIVVDSIAKLCETYYVSLEVGRQMGELIRTKNKNGIYYDLHEPKILASNLTSDLRSINGDLHMSVHFSLPTNNSDKKQSSVKIDRSGQWTNYGFQEVKILDGNVGYLKISHFTNWNHFENAKKVVNSSFNFLQNAEALIFDLRNNGGGFEEIVAYLISYLFDGESIHLSDYYYRYEDSRSAVYTTIDLPGKKMPDVPVYVLVNSRSASAAESFAYMLKHLERALVIGETTMGAGNGAMTHKVNDRFSVSIASETTINTMTKTSFEQVGVKPNVQVSSEEAFELAYRLALENLMEKNAGEIDSSNYQKVIEFNTNSFIVKLKDVNEYEKYVGLFKDDNLSIQVTLENGQLLAEVIGRSGKVNLVPKEKDIFIVEGLQERVQFLYNEDNEVYRLNGIDSPMDLLKVVE